MRIAMGAEAYIKKKTHSKSAPSCTPDETYLERSQLSVEQFLAMLRFEHRSKLEELPITLE
jgi:hypothetical protein